VVGVAKPLRSGLLRCCIQWLILIRDGSIAYVVTTAPELSPLFRSDAQGEILALLLLNPDQAFTIADVARTTNTSYASTHREVERLLRTQVLTDTPVGLHRQVRANSKSPALKPLQELLLLSYGPATVLPPLLHDIDGIEEAYIYGSWAARRMGAEGSPPRDIDLLIVGNPSRNEIYEAADEASRVIGREVNPRIVSPDTWRTSDDPFTTTVRSGPLVRLPLSNRNHDRQHARTRIVALGTG